MRAVGRVAAHTPAGASYAAVQPLPGVGACFLLVGHCPVACPEICRRTLQSSRRCGRRRWRPCSTGGMSCWHSWWLCWGWAAPMQVGLLPACRTWGCTWGLQSACAACTDGGAAMPWQQQSQPSAALAWFAWSGHGASRQQGELERALPLDLLTHTRGCSRHAAPLASPAMCCLPAEGQALDALAAQVEASLPLLRSEVAAATDPRFLLGAAHKADLLNA